MNTFALITGGSRGIGRAICLELARRGHSVLVNYQSNTAAAEETLRQVRALGGEGMLLPFDVSDRDATRRALSDWQEQNPDAFIEVLVNNAGIREDNLLLSMEDGQWDRVLGASLHGMYHATQALLKPMLLQRRGRIVNIVSLSGLKGQPGQVNYSAAKAGVIGATKALAQEIAKRGVTVNAIAPGFIKTDMTEGLDEAQLAKLVPMQRFGTPEEVASLAGFLASPEAAYITGQVISVNGGLYS